MSRVQATLPSSEGAWTKTNKRTWDETQLLWAKAATPWTAKKSLGWRKKPAVSQEAQKRLKAERQWDASKRQCQTAKQRARRQLDENEVNAWCDNSNATSDKSTYTTINFVFRGVVSKDEQGLNVKPLSEGVFSLVLEESFWLQAGQNIGIKFEYAISLFAAIIAIQIVWKDVLKIYVMLSVLSLGLIFSEEIEPCQIEIQSSSVASSMNL